MDPVQSHKLRQEFSDPPREFGMMPLWLWNDDLNEEELRRQIHEFYAKGMGGFVPHPRIGLSRRVGYLTEEYFRLLRLAVEEARRLGMKVVLYDEGSYPSGSAQGKVVAENPEYAARCLIMVQQKITGPATGYWRPNPGRGLTDQLVCVVQGREIAADTLDPESLELLTPEEPGLVRYALPEGNWRLAACWAVLSGGATRGVFAEEEDGSALAPPAGDLMNPDAVASFIRHTHEQYQAHVGDYFGSTIIGMFTDEPCPMGRGPKRGPKPWPFTPGLLEEAQAEWPRDVRRWLPALWLDCGDETPRFRKIYEHAVQARIDRVFYGAQSRWCSSHNLALTGHPERSDEMGPLQHFHWPGQDMVWRWVAPGLPSALEGPNSVAPKAASSAAALHGRRRSVSEALGAYGWRLSLDEAKWLLDWHLVRGNNLFFPHACFYSIRGRRAYESEPDLGVHNVWWPNFRILGDYVRRLCWLLTDGAEVCTVAIASDSERLAWGAARELLQAQIDFLYIDDAALAEAQIEGAELVINAQRFRAVVCDPPDALGAEARAKLEAFRAAGGMLLNGWEAGHLSETLTARVARDVCWPNAPDLRALHYRKQGMEFYLLVNEGEQPLEGEISLGAYGALELWNPLDGNIRPWPAKAAADNARIRTRLRLERRQTLVLAVDPSGQPDFKLSFPPAPGPVAAEIKGPWKAVSPSGQTLTLPCPGDWSRIRQWETYSGTLCFRTDFELPAELLGRTLYLDLGRIGDIAEVVINGKRAGVCAWAPYRLDVSQVVCAGQNTLEVRVTNSMANAYDGLQMPSGLMGPVLLRSAR